MTHDAHGAICLLADWFHEGNEDGCDCIKGLDGPLLCQEWAENILESLLAGGFVVRFDPQGAS